jgi:hypothetical protein
MMVRSRCHEANAPPIGIGAVYRLVLESYQISMIIAHLKPAVITVMA